MRLFLVFILSLCLHAVDIEFEVLGSGGPELDGRASTSYLLWIDGKARLLVDMGSGSMLRFEESGAKLRDLEAVVLTHLHIDHSVDLPAFVKAGYFSNRSRSLDILGPSGNVSFPSTSEFLYILFGPKGAYRYMQDVLTPQSDSFEIIGIDINSYKRRNYPAFSLELISTHHGIVPSLALRITVNGKHIVISGDTNDANHSLEKLIDHADLFVAHHAVPQTQQGYALSLHMRPDVIGKLAQKGAVKQVLLTHRMKRTEGKERQTLQVIRGYYKGEVRFANDHMRIKF